MQDYVHWHCSGTVLNQFSSTKIYVEIALHTEMMSALFLWGNVLLGVDLQKDAKKFKF